MNHGDEVLANIGDSSYIIPKRLIDQLLRATTTAPLTPSARDYFLKFLDAAGIEYGWEEHSCGDSNVSQVWFGDEKKTWDSDYELVFEFNAETGAYESLHIEG